MTKKTYMKIKGNCQLVKKVKSGRIYLKCKSLDRNSLKKLLGE